MKTIVGPDMTFWCLSLSLSMSMFLLLSASGYHPFPRLFGCLNTIVGPDMIWRCLSVASWLILQKNDLRVELRI